MLDKNHVGRRRRKKVQDSPSPDAFVFGSGESNAELISDEPYLPPYEECEPAFVEYEDWDSKEKGA
ncbi:unnamed protein product [Dibothriocephalus latus]|uniref:Uncharacterized protein n=1 Tax=Dibothriocephalus latus TaxID=60516 RepID=A0A3P7N1M0_DIBLA|nr:unnamed protein product [Dibothriocephalus latus]